MDIFFRDMYDDILENLPKKKLATGLKSIAMMLVAKRRTYNRKPCSDTH